MRSVPVLLLLAAGVSACGSSATAMTGHGTPATGTAASVSIPGADRFSPAVAETVRGGRIVLRNLDTDPHTVTSVPGDPSAFNVMLKPGSSATLVLDHPGAYRYYCALHARYDAATGQVAALLSADHPDEPMSGVLVVGGG